MALTGQTPKPATSDEDWTDMGIVRRYGLKGDDAANILDSAEQHRKRKAAEKAKALAKALRNRK